MSVTASSAGHSSNDSAAISTASISSKRVCGFVSRNAAHALAPRFVVDQFVRRRFIGHAPIQQARIDRHRLRRTDARARADRCASTRPAHRRRCASRVLQATRARTASRHQRLGRIEHDLDEVVRETAADDEIERIVARGQQRQRRLEVMALRALALCRTASDAGRAGSRAKALHACACR